MSKPDKKLPTAGIGAHVQVELISPTGEREALEFDLVAQRYADFAAGYLGDETPLARLILGWPAGATLPYQAEDVVAVRIVSITPAEMPAEEDLLRRQQSYRKAVRQAQRDNAISFASSMNSKWGDYDPSGIEHWDEER